MPFDWTEVGGSHGVEIRPHNGRIKSVLVATVLGIIATIMPGCGQGMRERFMASRVDYVMPHAGDGSQRIAMWPMTVAAKTSLAQAIVESGPAVR